MLERRRKSKLYQVVPQGEEGDLELGEGGGSGQEIGVVGPEEVREDDAWDEGAEAWDAEEVAAAESTEGEGGITPSTGSVGDEAPEVKTQDDGT